MADASSTVRDVRYHSHRRRRHRAAGFRSAALHCGIKAKADALDLAVIAADAPASAAGIFTTNLAQAAPVLVSQAASRREPAGVARAIVVNSGCANACTGDDGMADARANGGARPPRALGCPPEQVLVASTGVIGVELPMDKVVAGIRGRRRARWRAARAATRRAPS